MTTPRSVYAQSSDIRSRTWLQYRLDMKKKAIAELEFVPFLQDVLREKFRSKNLIVQKHGGDAQLWFDTSGRGVTQEPDYKASLGGDKSHLYEFQFAEETDDLQFFDFKEAKVGKKPRGSQRVPYTDREFFYVIKDLRRYAFVKPVWIAQHGKLGGVPAWGNSTAYRVPREDFLPLFLDGSDDLNRIIQAIDNKNYLLDFQFRFLDMEAQQIARELQQVIDEERLLSIVPRTPDGFYRVCFLLDKIGKSPDSPGVWLVYLLSLFSDRMRPISFARYMLSLDYLYFKCIQMQWNEVKALEAGISHAIAYVKRRSKAADGSLAIDPSEAPLEETREILFAVNLLEDLKQDAAVNVKADLSKAEKIFEMIPDVARTAEYVKKSENLSAAA